MPPEVRICWRDVIYCRKTPDSHRFIRGRSRVFYFVFQNVGTCPLSIPVNVVGTVAHQWMDLITSIQRSRIPFVFEICLIPSKSVFDTGMNVIGHGMHDVSVCRAFILVSHCTLSYRCTSEAQCQYARSLSVNLSLFIQFFLGTFFIGCDPQMYTVGVCLSCFDHRPGCYSTIDF